MRRLFTGLLLIIILICAMSSYKIETYDIPGTVVDPVINPRLNTYNCYDYIRKKFPKWNVNSYSNSELTALATLRTGVDSTYQILGKEPQYTQSCIVPVEHGFLYNANPNDSKFTISSCNISQPYHTLSLNNAKGPESPSGYVIDFSQSNNVTGIDYSDEKNFRDFLTSGYNVLDSYNLNIIHTLSNQIWVDPYTGPEKREAGLSNLNQDYLRTDIKHINIMNAAISSYKPMCMMDSNITSTSDNFMTQCGGSQQNDVTTMCCPEEPPCKKKQREIAAINAMIGLNKTNMDKMNETIKYIDNNNTSISNEAAAQNPPSPPPPPPPPVLQAPRTLQPIIAVANNQNPVSTSKAECSRPPTWCTHSGSVLRKVDCRGDGIQGDYLCSDNMGNKGTILRDANCGQVWPNAGNTCPRAGSAPAPGPVTFYEHCDYQGSWVSHGPGHYNMNQISLRNDTLSSIRIPAGRRVTLYWDANFSGASKTFTSDVSCLVNHGWNDQASSWIVS